MIRIYKAIYMRRLLGNIKIQTLWFKYKQTATDPTGAISLKKVYDELIPADAEITMLYDNMAKEEIPTHKIAETPASRAVDLAIQFHGWQGFVEGFVQYARNREAKLRLMGLSKESESWDKIASRIAALPKRPQF